MRFRASLLGSLVLSIGLLCSAPASSQEPAAGEDKEAVKLAREQFAQALSLQTAGDWAGALTLLKEVAAIKPTPQVRFNIALCEEKLGRLVAALGEDVDELDRVGELRAVRERSRAVDGQVVLGGPPPADGVEDLQPEPDGIHHHVTASTGRVVPVHLRELAPCTGEAFRLQFGRDVCRRLR